jgi:hypothetical protein
MSSSMPLPLVISIEEQAKKAIDSKGKDRKACEAVLGFSGITKNAAARTRQARDVCKQYRMNFKRLEDIRDKLMVPIPDAVRRGLHKEAKNVFERGLVHANHVIDKNGVPDFLFTTELRNYQDFASLAMEHGTDPTQGLRGVLSRLTDSIFLQPAHEEDERYVEKVGYYLRKGADPNHIFKHHSYKKLTAPLHLACAFGFTKIAKLLLDKGAKANLLVRQTTPLLSCIASGVTNGNKKKELVRLLLERGADPTLVSALDGVYGHRGSTTPLHDLLIYNTWSRRTYNSDLVYTIASWMDILKMLLKKTTVDKVNTYANPPHPDHVHLIYNLNRSMTPLQCLAQYQSTEYPPGPEVAELAAGLLLEAGADACLKSSDGKSVLQLATRHSQAFKAIIREAMERCASRSPRRIP